LLRIGLSVLASQQFDYLQCTDNRMKSHFYDRSLEGVYEAVGGIEAFRRISARFHHKIEHDPELRGFFPKNMAALEERLALYLAEHSGGPAGYTAARGKNSLFCRHAHLAIGTAEAELWLAHMKASLAEEGVSEETSTQLLSNLAELAATLADPFVLLYHLPLPELREKLQEDPSLAVANDHGRNLICAAAIAWDVPRLRLLLEFGADVETKDAGGHNALYRVANGQGRRNEDGVAAIELLIAHGAKVNQVTGVGGMTPLHMASRRGTTGIAEALLDAGANIEARDKNGETPLRRAVNCGQEQMICLLLSRGANPRSTDRNGRNPLDAARTESIRELFAVRSCK
jgi:ankyrin repeat protein